MTSRIRAHIRSNIYGILALFLVLTGGTAQALQGSNTVFSDDIVNDEVRTQDIRTGHVGNTDLAGNSVTSGKVTDNNLTGSDIAANSLTGVDVNESGLKLAAEGWHEVGAPGEPPFGYSAFCAWKNYDGGVSHNSAAFLRDRHGFVHLKGMVKADGSSCNFGFAYVRWIFTLPDGYRPAKREVLVSISNGKIARISVDGPAAFGQGAGAVSVEAPVSEADAKQWVSLDGLSFRCAPSGSNGCP